MKKNDILSLYIEENGYEGEGIAKIDGFPVFVKGGIQGDAADVRIVKVNKNFAFGKIEGIKTPSPFRRTPICDAFGKCGGCSMMHINYDRQLQIKQNVVVNNLRKIAGLSQSDYDFEGIIGCDDEFNYRNKAQFPLTVENGKAKFGFYAPASHRVVPCENCKIQNNKINETAAAILEYINENNISVYDEKTGNGAIRHIYIRVSKSNEVMAVIVTNTSKELPKKDKLIEKVTAINGVKSIIQNINTRTDNIIMGNKNITLWGDDCISMALGELKFCVSPNSFFQVNPQQTEKLYGKAVEYAGLTGGETVFDLYCGVGSISLFMAQKAKKVYGVEIVEDAIKNAKINAKINNVDNTEFYAGDCTEVVGKIIDSGAKADVVVVDPPRKGCDSTLLELINKISPQKIVYVSCNSATLARDIALLADYGYKLKKATAVDMFPQTSHVECVAMLCKNEI